MQNVDGLQVGTSYLIVDCRYKLKNLFAWTQEQDSYSTGASFQ